MGEMLVYTPAHAQTGILVARVRIEECRSLSLLVGSTRPVTERRVNAAFGSCIAEPESRAGVSSFELLTTGALHLLAACGHLQCSA
jgi:hypothetical protein